LLLTTILFLALPAPGAAVPAGDSDLDGDRRAASTRTAELGIMSGDPFAEAGPEVGRREEGTAPYRAAGSALTPESPAARRPLELALVLDTSGSLHPAFAGVDAIGYLKTASTQFVNSFDDELDMMALVRFASGRVIPFPLEGDFKAPITAAIAEFEAQGGTGTHDALAAGHDQVADPAIPGSFRAMLVFTDGRPTCLRDLFTISETEVDGVIGGYQDSVAAPYPPHYLFDPFQVHQAIPWMTPDYLPDGRPATTAIILAEAWQRALDAGSVAREDGVTIFTIGLGNPYAGPVAQPDPLLLIALANVETAEDPLNPGETIVNPYFDPTQPIGAFLFAPDATQLEQMFNQAAQEIKARLNQCGPPELVFPPDGMTIESDELTLDWSDVYEDVGYEVQVGTACGSGGVYETAGSEQTVFDLADETEYHWRVRAECQWGWGPWTNCRTFTTAFTVPVELAGFEARATHEGVALKWTTTEEVVFGRFFVLRNAARPDDEYSRLHEDPLEPDAAGRREYSYLDGDVIPGTLYHYKLEAIKPGGRCVFFGPYPVMATEKEALYSLAQNIPNPFHRDGKTAIHYSVESAGRIEMRIVDAAGRLVRTITSHAEVGRNVITWDGRSDDGRKVPGGVYFYRLTAGRFVGERRMLLVD
jgi:hypothetical protein